jgi:hypothetical protein
MMVLEPGPLTIPIAWMTWIVFAASLAIALWRIK